MDRYALDVFEREVNKYETDPDYHMSIGMLEQLELCVEDNFTAEQMEFMLDHCYRNLYEESSFICEDLLKAMREQIEKGATFDSLEDALSIIRKANWSEISGTMLNHLFEMEEKGVSREGIELFGKFESTGGTIDELRYSDFMNGFFYSDSINKDRTHLVSLDALDKIRETLEDGLAPERVEKYVRLADKELGEPGYAKPYELFMDGLRDGLSDSAMDKLVEFASQDVETHSTISKLFEKAMRTNEELVDSLGSDIQRDGLMFNPLLLGAIEDGLNKEQLNYLIRGIDDGVDKDTLNVVELNMVKGLSVKETEWYLFLYGNKLLENSELNAVFSIVADKGLSATPYVLAMTDFNGSILNQCEKGQKGVAMMKMAYMFESGLSVQQVEQYWDKNLSYSVLDAYKAERNHKDGYSLDELIFIGERYGDDALEVIVSADRGDFNLSLGGMDLVLASDIANYSNDSISLNYNSIGAVEDFRRSGTQSVEFTQYVVERSRDYAEYLAPERGQSFIPNQGNPFARGIGSATQIAELANAVGFRMTDYLLKSDTDRETGQQVPLSVLCNAIDNGVKPYDICTVLNKEYTVFEVQGVLDALKQGVSMDQIQQHYTPAGSPYGAEFYYDEMTRAIKSGVAPDIVEAISETIPEGRSDEHCMVKSMELLLEGKYEKEHSVDFDKYKKQSEELCVGAEEHNITNKMDNDDPDGRD